MLDLADFSIDSLINRLIRYAHELFLGLAEEMKSNVYIYVLVIHKWLSTKKFMKISN